MTLERNAAGRLVPTDVNGRGSVPFAGVGGHRPTGRKAAPHIASCVDYPADGDKRAGSIAEALRAVGLADGMTVSSHHHLRNGDSVANRVFDAAASLGVRDLMWFPSASFPVHANQLQHLDSGVIHHIEGSMNGPLGAYCSEGKMRGLGVLRSHGGRWQAIQDGEVPIDVAVIAAPTADAFGNATGDRGPAACGLLGFALADSMYAEKVIVVTDNLVPFPVPAVADPGQQRRRRGGGGLHRRPDSDRLRHHPRDPESGPPADRRTGRPVLCRGRDHEAGLLLPGRRRRHHPGLRHLPARPHAGRGGHRPLRPRRFNQYMTAMLQEGLIEVHPGRPDLRPGGRALHARDPRHVNTSPFTSYNFHGKGNFASMVDVAVLGATEVDLAFNGNVVTHSDGRLLHGIGGWQNCLAARCTMLLVPSYRDRIPVVVDEVTTLCGPGELIDVVVTERGIAVNPRRQDLLDAVAGSNLPIRPIADLKAELDRICGTPSRPQRSDRPVAVVKWVDGTVLDTVWQVGG
jgi:citrate lyase subunit alpha/citrate CoA-transferase